MQKKSYLARYLQTCIFAYFLATGLVCAQNSSASVKLTPIQADILRIQELSENNQTDAIAQLSALQHNLPVGASMTDQRDALIALITLYSKDEQQEQVRKFISELNALGTKYHDPIAMTMVQCFQAKLLRNEGQLEQARAVIEQAVLSLKTITSNDVISKVHSEACMTYQALGDFKSALKHQLLAMNALGEGTRSDEYSRARAYNTASNLYLSLKDPAMALGYIDKATQLAESLGAHRMLATLTLNRGVAYSDQGKLVEAGNAYAEAMRLARKVSDRSLEVTALNNLSDAAFEQGQFQACVQYAQQTLELSQKLANQAIISSAQINLGLCHMGLGLVRQGAGEVNMGIAYLRNSKAKPDIEQVLGQLATAYEKAGLYKEAYAAMVEQRDLSMELFRDDRDRSVAEMKARFDASEREKQIEMLEQKNQVQSVELKNKSLQRIIFILASLIALAIAIIIWYLYRKVSESNRNLQEANVKLEHQSTRDPLTGLLNRRAFHDTMNFRTQMTERRSTDNKINPPHALVILDIDHFKVVNDHYGHAGGDMVLIEISNRLTNIMRDNDMLMRWGGEEFLIFLNHIPPENLAKVVERILITVGARPIIFDKNSLAVTISAGYISLAPGADSEVDLNWEKSLNLADSALYMAKTRGRNQAIGIKTVEVSSEEFDELLQGDLENAIKQGKVTIQQIEGPVQHEILKEF